jgi:hypothetical protein
VTVVALSTEAGVGVALRLEPDIATCVAGQLRRASRRRARHGAEPARQIAEDGTETDVPLGQIQVGDELRVHRGEAAAVDGVVLEGYSAIDEAMATGAPIPGTGAHVMRADKVADTLLSRLAFVSRWWNTRLHTTRSNEAGGTGPSAPRRRGARRAARRGPPCLVRSGARVNARRARRSQPRGRRAPA